MHLPLQVGFMLVLALGAIPDLVKAGSPCDGLSFSPPEVLSKYDWRTKSPVEHLNHLKSLSDASFTVWGCSETWVREEHIPALLSLLDSRERCANQSAAISSFRDWHRSTVGHEAAWLIEAFRVGRFPPSLGSSGPLPSAAELRAWWAERLSQKPVQPPNTSLERTRER